METLAQIPQQGGEGGLKKRNYITKKEKVSTIPLFKKLYRRMDPVE